MRARQYARAPFDATPALSTGEIEDGGNILHLKACQQPIAWGIETDQQSLPFPNQVMQYEQEVLSIGFQLTEGCLT